MPNYNSSTSVTSPESSDQRITDSQPLQIRSSMDGPVAIFWDIENCPVPSDVRPEDVAGNVRMALRVHPIITGSVVTFSAYGDFNAFPRRVREGCQRTGVKLIDVPNGRKDAADKAILIDMFLFALDNPPQSSIMLISGDVDFSPALHILGQRGYTVILVIPSCVGVSSALCNAGKFVWDWQSIAHGEGFVPPPESLNPPRLVQRYEISRHHIDESQISVNNNPDGMCEDTSILYKGSLRSCYNSRQEYACLPPDEELDPAITGLKGQLVTLLEMSGGCMPLLRVQSEYQKYFGKPLNLSEFGAFKLMNLVKKMGDTIVVEGKGNKRFAYLLTKKENPSAAAAAAPPPLVLLRGDDDWKEGNEGNGNGGSTEKDRVDRKQKRLDRNMEEFKIELQEILVAYSCRIAMECLEDIYRQKYKKPLKYRKLGVYNLEQLIDKIRDVVVVYEDPATKKQFIEAFY